MALKREPHVLLETMALCANEGQQPTQARHLQGTCHPDGDQSQGAVASIEDLGDPNRHDQSMAQGARPSICQRAVGKHSLSG